MYFEKFFISIINKLSKEKVFFFKSINPNLGLVDKQGNSQPNDHLAATSEEC